jgi:hypothetical protein
MKPQKLIAILALLIAGLFTSGIAAADRWHGGGHGGHGHVGIGLYFGPGFGYPYPYYPYPAYPYYYPPVVVSPASPPTYIEQDGQQQAEAQPQDYYWYHCDNPNGYYPYIKECPGGWQKVLPEPPKQ